MIHNYHHSPVVSRGRVAAAISPGEARAQMTMGTFQGYLTGHVGMIAGDALAPFDVELEYPATIAGVVAMRAPGSTVISLQFASPDATSITTTEAAVRAVP